MRDTSLCQEKESLLRSFYERIFFLSYFSSLEQSLTK